MTTRVTSCMKLIEIDTTDRYPLMVLCIIVGGIKITNKNCLAPILHIWFAVWSRKEASIVSRGPSGNRHQLHLNGTPAPSYFLQVVSLEMRNRWCVIWHPTWDSHLGWVSQDSQDLFLVLCGKFCISTIGLLVDCSVWLNMVSFQSIIREWPTAWVYSNIGIPVRI